MQFKDLTKEEIRGCFDNIAQYLANMEQKWVRYVDLGCKVVRLISYSDDFLPHVEKQLTYVLKDKEDRYDATLILWNEKDVFSLGKTLSEKFNPRVNMRLRIELLYSRQNMFDIEVCDRDFSNIKPVINVQSNRKFFIASDIEKNTYYYGVNDLSPEEFIKEGHIFVQFFNTIIKTPTSNLAHGAVIGLNGDGILFCARGQRGKSTLSVLSMIKGFEYVSDDYLILHEKDGKLLSSPIYSIITLSPEMYNRLYNFMEGCRFVSNNARKDKYVFNIANFHDRFKKNYPIKFCIFPEIVSDLAPSIRLCSVEEKGRAIVQLIQSTLSQTVDLSENRTVTKMLNMVKDFPFYKLNLCYDIDKNTEFLQDFMNNLKNMEHRIVPVERICTDITFDLANILDCESGTIYSMNKFATNVYENLIQGVSDKKILNELKQFSYINENIERDFVLFLEKLESKGIFKQNRLSGKKPVINKLFAREDKCILSFVEHAEEKYMELVSYEENENELCLK